MAALLSLAVLIGAGPAAAEVFRFVAADGTVHVTNTPTDPRYLRAGLVGRAQGGWTPPRAVGVTAYAREIAEAAARYGIPERLIQAVIRVESGFNPRAISPKGAQGLMQLMPETAAQLGVRDVFDPRENIDAGVRHLRTLVEQLGDDLRLVLAAYNAGLQAVLAWRGIPPYPETRQYVVRVLEHYQGTSLMLPRQTFRAVERDGTVVYTNLPWRARVF